MHRRPRWILWRAKHSKLTGRTWSSELVELEKKVIWVIRVLKMGEKFEKKVGGQIEY